MQKRLQRWQWVSLSNRCYHITFITNQSYDIMYILKIRDKNSRLEYYNDMTDCKAHDRCNNCISSRYLRVYTNMHGDDDNNDEKIFCSSWKEKTLCQWSLHVVNILKI